MRQRRAITGADTPSVIAGRYRVESELARGGMGTVYAVVDESTGRKVALKRMGGGRCAGATRRKGATADREASLQFQLEYLLLSRLRHPSIIEVHDYGVEGCVPYYTMELLEGSDLRELSPVPAREACRLVRDVASSLALIHAHRLVHRDVSPSNVRVTVDGRAKLLDFGTMTPFGVPPDVAGTPSCVAPEALNGSALDERADLYSLGAVLYWLLTGREAFPVRRLDDLPSFLETPPAPPSSAAPESSISSALDAFVLSMLSPDPLARPASAAVVIATLETLAGLEPEEGREIARAYFSSSKMVGRALQLKDASQCIDAALAGAGRGVLAFGGRGLGKSRFLREVALQAQIRGATVIAVDASLQVGPHATARALGARLLQASPESALAAARPHAPYLAHLFPELADKLAPVELAVPPQTPGEWRVRLLGALHDWFLGFAESRTLVVAVDDVDRADEASAGLLASLARASAHRKLLVVTTAREPSGPQTDVVTNSTQITLRRLEMADVVELLGSLFGGAPNTPRFARWLLSLSGGTPLGVMELLRHLVVARVVRYADGVWMLPNETPAEGLPGSVEEAITSRFSRLSPQALALAEALSVGTTTLPIGMCLELAEASAVAQSTSGGGGPEAAIAALDELVTDGMLEGSEGSYRFAEDSLRELLLARLDDGCKKKLHRLVGRALERHAEASPAGAAVAGFHLLRGGEEERGSKLLALAGKRLLTETDDLHAAVPALEAALAAHRRRRRPTHELAAIAGQLASAAFFVDRRLAQTYGAEALELLSRATGLTRAAALEPAIGERAALAVGVATSVATRWTSRSGRDVTTRELYELLLRSAASLSGVASVCLDGPAIRRVLRVIQPLEAVAEPRGAPWIVRYCRSLLDLCEGRLTPARSDLLVLLSQLESEVDRPEFPEAARRIAVAGVLYALGVIESMKDGPAVLEYAARLEALDLRLYDMVAEQLRTVYHAHRGESGKALAFRAKVERYAMMRGSAWQVEVWDAPVMLLLHLNEGDVVALRRTAERLSRLAAEIPSLERYALIAQAALHKFRGRLSECIAVLESAIRLEEGPFAGRGPAVGLLAEAYNSLGNHARAEELTRDFLQSIGPEDRGYVRQNQLPLIQHAHALAGLGDFEMARRELDASIEEHASGRGPLTLGLLHQARARVSLWEGDARGFEMHIAAMERWLRPTDNPALIAACERLRLEARRDRLTPVRRFYLEHLPPLGDDLPMTTSRHRVEG